MFGEYIILKMQTGFPTSFGFRLHSSDQPYCQMSKDVFKGDKDR